MTNKNQTAPGGADDAPGGPEFSRLHSIEPGVVSRQIEVRSRKNHTVILQELKDQTANDVAARLGVHPSLLSRLKGEGEFMLVAKLLAALGLKVVPVDATVFIEPDQYK